MDRAVIQAIFLIWKHWGFEFHLWSALFLGVSQNSNILFTGIQGFWRLTFGHRWTNVDPARSTHELLLYGGGRYHFELFDLALANVRKKLFMFKTKFVYWLFGITGRLKDMPVLLGKKWNGKAWKRGGRVLTMVYSHTHKVKARHLSIFTHE